MADLQRMVYPHQWSPISCRSSAGLGKFAGQRPTFYHCATPPAICIVAVHTCRLQRCGLRIISGLSVNDFRLHSSSKPNGPPGSASGTVNFSTLLLIYLRLFMLAQKKTSSNSCSAALAVYLLLFNASYYLHSPKLAQSLISAGLGKILAYFRLSRKFFGGGGLTNIRRLSRGLFSACWILNIILM